MFSKIIPKKLLNIIAIILTVILVGMIGFKIIGGPEKSFLDALYMTAITITTVGYGDIIGLENHPLGKVFTIMYVFIGAGAIAYLFTTLAAYIIEGELKKIFRRRKMEKRIARMRDHYIVCGIGMVGLYVVHEMYLTKRPFLAIDHDETKIEVLRANNINADLLVGDATENEVLWKAMIEHAHGLFATTDSDNDNIVISLTARQLNPSLRIVSRCNDTKNIDKLKRAGADSVVALNFIGGLRMASEMIRPHVTSFLDMMLRDKYSPMKVEEVHVPANSPFIGRPVKDVDFKTIGNLMLISARKKSGEWVYNPYPDTIMEGDMSLIIIATPEEKELLIEHISGGSTFPGRSPLP
ncbi:MAG: potassium channel protein [Syntrophorhabdaceae bacterium]|nr:potassium channel protein [Syntrophorhabdaceae bacterium]MDD4195446.1 potassium channel protein [Syntrophorhabdaceae bacterium]